MPGLMKQYLNSPPLPTKEKERQAALLSPMLWATLVVVTLSNLGQLAGDPQNLMPLIDLIIAIVPVIGATFLLRRGYVLGASRVFVFFMWLVVTVLVWKQGGLTSPVLPSYLLVILAAGLLMGARTSYLFVGMSAAATAYLLLENERLQPFTGITINYWIGITSNLILLALIVHLAVKTLVTALHEAEQSQAKLAYQAMLLQGVSEAIIATDLQFKITGWNKAAERLYGWDKAEAVGQSLDQLLQEQLLDQTHDAAVQQLFETGLWQGELIHSHKEGYTIEIEGVVTLLRDDQGQPTGVISINHDIRQQKQAERRYHNLFETMPVMVVLTRYDEKELAIIEGCNPYFLQQMGYELGEVIERPLAHFYSPESRHSLISGGYYRAMEEESVQEERTLVTRDGRMIETMLRAVPIYSANGQIKGTQAMYMDISARKEAERKVQEYAHSLEQKVAERTDVLQQQAELLREQNAELDAFAHTVAHDLKNPLAQMMGYSELLEVDYDAFTPDEHREMLLMIQRSAHKMKNIIEELLLLASIRREEVRTEPIYMPDVINETIYRLSTLIEEKQAVLDLPAQWPVAWGYLPWIEEVWTNYLSNALKYGGNPPHIILGATEREDGMIAFWVQDHGPGLTAEQKAQMFKPFTRLNRGRGTGHGLGLSIVERIVTKLGGQVYVESEEGRGSTFGFTLPAVQNIS